MRINYYGFDHNKINKKFSGELTFMNTFTLIGESMPFAVYKAKKPDKKKGHKKYMLVMAGPLGGLVRGLSEKEMEKHRMQHAITCKSCTATLHSVDRHDFRECPCGKSFVDGGRDYLKMGGEAKAITMDLLKDKVV